ncbi:hydantoinase/oxoprolinase N-terminal domain-containing protein [Alicyclobacillus sp. SO9]|uniref:hydantoinase/oxoprolinase N-terminal domain-containing protein n=1 Tax=Alicyclobacillus sp. SO9 TaxID=2665646 RepID=UPI0018E7CE12|nr:hydantoinase/oxoprolinase family protein [Alicyclobacillus sp. SO9]QQE80472.1 hydantoinase/oxoprolinase family protein [Alicyclobacillus sp. SO9]
MSHRLGIDVGGTNTDVVLLNSDNEVVAKTKVAVTTDIVTGIRTAVAQVLDSSGINPAQITHAMLGTTQVTNAIIERSELNDVAIIRLGAPATRAVKPLAGWPEDLRERYAKYSWIVGGGHEFDGREIAPLDEEELQSIAHCVKGNVGAVAVTGVFSPVNTSHEERAARIFREVLGEDIPISLSYQLGSVGLLERENATVLNAAVSNVAKRATLSFQQALVDLDVYADLYLAQNDGTLMSVDYALLYPILTIACGPTNSMRGAAHLTGMANAVVVDVGGTSTDVGVLVNGFPRESFVAVDVGGVRTNFRMPDLYSLGLGGGSLVIEKGDDVTVGPKSVGYRIVQEGRAFGGSTTTFTDVVVALNKAKVGTHEVDVPHELADTAYKMAIQKVAEAVDRMKTSAKPVPLVLVGGGSVLLPNEFEGVSEVHRPENFDVANAIGAAIAQVSGRVDRIFAMDKKSRDEVLEEAKSIAFAEAIRAGADASTMEVVEVEEVPIAYLPGNAVRIKVTVAGTLASYHAESRVNSPDVRADANADY